jgi:ribonuclease BN (tRNA processing enzyme)
MGGNLTHKHPRKVIIMLKLITLGTGNAFAHGKAYQSAHLIETNEKKILFDCGPTILLAIQHAEVDLSDLDYVFISHLHGDHLSGIPFLLLSFKYDLERTRPLTIVGPFGLRDQINHALKGSYPGLLTNDLFKIVELNFGESYKIYDQIQVTPFAAFHIPNAFCYKLIYRGLKVIYSGDNELNEIQLQEFDETTVLIHELTTMYSNQGGHTSWALMKKFIDVILSKVRYVVLVHTSTDVRNEPETTFPSRVIRAKDGSIFEFTDRGNLQKMLL